MPKGCQFISQSVRAVAIGVDRRQTGARATKLCNYALVDLNEKLNKELLAKYFRKGSLCPCLRLSQH
jgi:hypothetical protein